ncbi:MULTISPECIES: YdeI/OmpD-associated family protein [unclassified Yoonia]|uniref:YdeI/OmpD-associated family protein n=1 Tax=unclassified Yoonia TaxID=2629118 RepID=UPI002AFE8550|nr:MULTISPECIES: YdeI/OmpD-associated family protein [unclassified Yoonia]
MTDWVTFDGQIEPLVWGDKTYTILRLPREVEEALLAQGARRVEGEFGDHPVNLAITRAPPVDGAFLYAGRSLMDRTGLEPGEIFEVRLRPAPSDAVETPDDLEVALAAAGLSGKWEAMTAGRRRGMIYKVDSAKSETTRLRRIAALVTEVAGT